MPIEVTVVIADPDAPTLDPLAESSGSSGSTTVTFTSSTPVPDITSAQAVINAVIDPSILIDAPNPLEQSEALTYLLSFNGRVGDDDGDVAPATGDYPASYITNDSDVSGGSVKAALDWLNTNKQTTNTFLTNIGNLTTVADRMIYTTGVDTVALATLTSFARTLLDDADQSAARTTLGVAIGTDVQAYSARLAEIAALSPTDGGFIVGNGSSWVLETGDTLLASLDAVGGRSSMTENKVMVADANGDARNGLMTDDGSQVRISGNLDVTGAIAEFDCTTFMVGDPLVKIAKDNVSADAVDIGIYGVYENSGDKYTGLFRDATDGKYRLFYGLEPEPTDTVNTVGTGYQIASIVAHLEDSSVLITGGSITGITDLAVADGGTGASTAEGARANLDAVGGRAGLTVNTVPVADANGDVIDSSITDDGSLINIANAINFINLYTSYAITGDEPVGSSFWDIENKTMSTVLDDGIIGQHFHEVFIPVQNDTGVAIPDGKVCTYAGSIGSSGNIRTELTVAAASEHPMLTIGISTSVISEVSEENRGKVTIQGKVRGIQTDGVNYGEVWVDGDIVYKSSTIAGGLTNVPPEAPIPAIPMAVVVAAHATNGTLLVRPQVPTSLTMLSDVNGTPLTESGQFPVWDTVNEYFDFTSNIKDFVDRSTWNGTFRESFNALVSSDGVTITMSLQSKAGGDLTMQFSDGDTTLDCDPACTIELTAGSTTVGQENFIYVPQSTKVLTKSTTGWPTTEHIKVGYFFVFDAAYTQSSGGAFINQNWNDEYAEYSDNMGHITHIGSWIRRQKAEWYSGVDGAGVDDYITIVSNSGTPDNVYFKCSAGVVSQMHLHNYAAKDMSTGSDAHIINHPTTPYLSVTDLNGQLTDSAGVSMSGRYFTLVFAGVANKGGQYSPLLVNLPAGSYNNLADAVQDVSGYNYYALPREFTKESSTGFTICAVTFKHSAALGGTWTVENTVSLLNGGATGGTSGGGGGSTEFNDALFRVFNNLDVTKELALSLAGVSTGTTRTLTVPDADGIIQLQPSEGGFEDGDKTNLDNQSGTNTGDEPDATTTVKGIVELAADGEDAANVVVQGNDSRLDPFVGDSGAGGSKGLVPAPATGDATKFLKGDGTWATAGGGVQNNYSAIVDPTVNDDVSSGYTAGSIWINTITDKAFMCTYALTGSAVWQVVTGTLEAESDCSSADQTETLPALTAALDGFRYQVYKFGSYKCTIQPTGTDAVGNSGAGYGVETLDAEDAGIVLVADYSTTTWHVISATGRWAVEGAKIWVPTNKQYNYNATTTIYQRVHDKITGHVGTSYNDMVTDRDGPFGLYTGRFPFNGTNQYINFLDSPAFDFFGSLTDSWTLSIWVKFDNATIAGYEYVVSHYEDNSNLWRIERTPDEKLDFKVSSGGSTILSVLSSAHADTDWHQVDCVKVGTDVAIYVDGVHEGNATLSSADTFSGSFYFGQSGSGANYLDGSLADPYIVAQNIFSVDPTDSGSTTVVRTQPAKLIYQ